MSVDILQETQLLHEKVHRLFVQRPLYTLLVFAESELKDGPARLLAIRAKHPYGIGFDVTQTRYMLERSTRVYDLKNRCIEFASTLIEVPYVFDEQIAEAVDTPAVLEGDEHEERINTLAMMRESIDAFGVEVTEEYFRRDPEIQRREKFLMS